MDARALITSLAGGLVLAVGVVLALSSGSAAQTGSVAPDANLQVSWSDSAMADG